MSDLSNPKSSVESSSMSELPHGWAWASLNELSSLINGDRGRNYPSKSELFNSGIPFINAGHILDGKIDFSRMNYIAEEHFNLLGGGKIQCNDILYCLRGSLGKTALITDTGKGSIASSLVVIRPLKNSDPKYLYYFLVSPFGKDEISKHDNGSAQPNLSAANVGLYCIPVSPLNEQRRIVAKLDSLFTRSRRAREELERIPKLCDRYKQAVLASAFRGDLTADWRKEHADVLTAKDFLVEADIQFSDESDLHSLPSGWAWVLAGNLCKIKSGVALGKKRALDTQLVELPYLRVANVQRGWLDLTKIKTVLVTPKEAEALCLNTGDILMNEGGDRDKLGRGWVWEGKINKCIHQNHVFRLRLKTDKVPSRYISYYANEFGQQYFIDQGKQTTNLASISMSKLSSFPVPIASPREMELIVQLVEKLFKAIDLMAQEYQKASKLCDRLEQATLSKAFRGELVPQDPNDEPASALLERILAERQQPKSKAVKSKQKPGGQS